MDNVSSLLYHKVLKCATGRPIVCQETVLLPFRFNLKPGRAGLSPLFHVAAESLFLVKKHGFHSVAFKTAFQETRQTGSVSKQICHDLCYLAHV